MSQLEIKNLTLAYDGEAVVTDLSFNVQKGDYVCIVGENGSGKSTLMKSILGLIKPLSGSIIFGDGAKCGTIGYLPLQQSAQRDFPASVKEVVMSGFAGKTRLPIYTKEMKRKALESMELLQIDGLAARCYRELSGGQQQRVLLARALCATEDMLLLDEPINGLDPNAAADMYSCIKQLNSSGLTVIMISHDIASAVTFADRILHLSSNGYFFGTTDEYLQSGFGDGFLKDGAL